jgi:SAM-dependent methyltransferase
MRKQNKTRFQLFSLWLTKPLGKSVLNSEKKALSALWSSVFGQRLLLLGNQKQQALLTHHRFRITNVLSPTNIEIVYKTLSEMPGEANIIDTVLLPHTLEFTDRPHPLLREVHYLLKPNGNVILIGFNPWSLFGLRQLFSLRRDAPWCGDFYSAFRVRDWLTTLDFEIVETKHDYYHTPFNSPKWLKKISPLKMLGKIMPSLFGGIYIIVARKNIVGMTPEKARWRILDHIMPHHAVKPVTRSTS